MRINPKKLCINLVKVAIAVIGLWIVIWPPWKAEPVMTWDDRITLLPSHPGLVDAKKSELTAINAVQFVDPVKLKMRYDIAPVKAGDCVVQFPARPVRVLLPDETTASARRLTDPPISWTPEQMVRELPAGYFEQVNPDVKPPEPELLVGQVHLKLQIGLRHLIVQCNKPLIAGAWALLVIPFLITAWRWRKLMEPQGIHLPFSKCLALTFVGQFYSTILPGITGGDLVKIIYTSRVTGSKTKSMVTILLDRVIGLLALLAIAFVAALIQATGSTTMRYVALLIGAALAGFAVCTVAYFSRRLRRMIGLGGGAAGSTGEPSGLRSKLVTAILQADETLHLYRGHMGVLAAAFAVSLITQIVLPISAWLAGLAFGMTAGPGSYMVYVPLAILAASVPITPPQGVGVTEMILSYFFSAASASQTFALAQAVRFLPILWNLVGAYWVVRGDYSRHEATKAEADAALQISGLDVKQVPPDCT